MEDNSTAPTPLDSPSSGIYPTHALRNMHSRSWVTSRLCLAIFGAVLGMFNFGYHVGVINAPQAVMEEFYNFTYAQRTGDTDGMDRDTLDLLWGFTVAVYAVGGMLGACTSSWWADNFGRRRSLMISCVPAIVAAVLMAAARTAASFELVIIGRLVVGYSCGLYTSICPLYTSEISPRTVRGAMGTVSALGITLGLLASQILGLAAVLGTADRWPVLLGVSGLAPLLQLTIFIYVPESPRYLLSKGQAISAEAALMILRDCDNFEGVKLEMAELVHEQNLQTSQTSISELLTSRQYRVPLIILIVIHMSQQLSGFSGIIYYSTDIFESVGIPAGVAGYATLSIGGLLVGMSFIVMFLMDISGRRSLQLIGIFGMILASLIFTVTYSLADYLEGLEYPCLLSVLVFVVFFSLGPGTVPWLIGAEMFPQGPRAAAVSVGVLVNWFSNFITAQFFPLMLSNLDTYVMLPFSVLMVFYFCFLYLYMPETKNKSIEDISATFLQTESVGFVTMTTNKADDYRSITREGAEED